MLGEERCGLCVAFGLKVCELGAELRFTELEVLIRRYEGGLRIRLGGEAASAIRDIREHADGCAGLKQAGQRKQYDLFRVSA